MNQEPAKRDKFQGREDLTGEHKIGDAGQIIFAVLFFTVYIIDSFFLKRTTFLNDLVPTWLRVPLGIVLLILAGTMAWSGLKIVFGEVREEPQVIRKGPFKVVRHPIYMAEVLMYAGQLCFNLSLAAAVIWIAAAIFLHQISRHEERLLLARFGDEYQRYMNEVGMWLPKLRK